VSTTDPDSTYATKGGTPARLGYYDNYLVDNGTSTFKMELCPECAMRAQREHHSWLIEKVHHDRPAHLL